MDEQALKKLREVTADCPSDLDLQQLHAGELSPESAARLEAHVSGCATCQAQAEKRKRGFAAYPELNPQPLLDAIKQRVQKDREQRKAQRERRRFLRRVAYIASPLAAAAAIAIVLAGNWRTPTDPNPPGDTVREKGGPVLYVYKLVGERSQRVASGDHFRAGERLRFVIDLPTPGHVNILGVEASGAMYVAWPNSPGISTERAAGKLQELPGAGLLDASGGREMLYLIHCPLAVGPPAAVCQTGKDAHKDGGKAGAAPSCPSGCALVPFVLDKGKE